MPNEPPGAAHPSHRSGSPAIRRAAATLLLLLFGCLVALVAAEVFLRVYNPLGQRLWGDRIVLPRNERQVVHNTVNPRLPETIIYSRNSLGFRGPEPPASLASALTVVAVGGSTTESRYQSDGDTWPDRVGQALGPHFRDLWLDNAGLDGHSTFGHLMLLEQYLVPMRPRVLVFLVGVNDVGRESAKHVDVGVGPGDRATWVTRLARKSALVATLQNLGRAEDARAARLFVFGALDLRRLEHLTYTGRRPEKALREHRELYVPAYRDRLAAIVRECQKARILPIFITQPALYGPVVDDRTRVDLGTMLVDEKQKINGDLAWQILELYNDATRELGRERGVTVIELARALPKSSRLFYDFVHYTDEGSREVAGIVAPPLCRALARAFPEFVVTDCPS
jgi:lysophospholipase L1-like esterase